MALSPSQLKEMLGTVVPVDDEPTVTFQVPTVNVPSQPVPTGPGPGSTSGPYPPGPHKIVGGGDEHRVITARGQQSTVAAAAAHVKYSQRSPKFSAIVNEYVGACMEDHCNIGKKHFS